MKPLIVGGVAGGASAADRVPGPRVGDHVADLAFLRPDGSTVHLSEFPGPLLLVFLRHLR